MGKCIEKVFAICTGVEASIFKCDYPWASVSISTNPGCSYVIEDKNRIGWLNVDFGDHRNEWVSPKKSLEGDVFTIKKACQIVHFFESMWDRVGCFMLHEEDLPSRASAVAAAAIHIFHGRGKNSWVFEKFNPNILVYNTILQYHYGNS